MWIFTKVGFFSIVQKREDQADDMLTVRSRRPEDLEALAKYVPGLEAVARCGTDYPFRARVSRPELAAAVAEMVKDIDYSNYKNTQPHDRHDIYMRVWSDVRALES